MHARGEHENSMQKDPRPEVETRTFVLQGISATNCTTKQPFPAVHMQYSDLGLHCMNHCIRCGMEANRAVVLLMRLDFFHNGPQLISFAGSGVSNLFLYNTP
ncbi:hypothetical protein XENORESO_005295 [Xenotaenia resolanae]|uniref:Uncharacterized protein n=1 Tax=Xenotaenia resolanae TaxID=208358 RepID=A0ABV0W4D5_9TELE